ncbi:hypothetical protein GCM10009111_27510 [Colwellia asteriadis]|uniref:Uncharacterized protein n=1 Tax=Colwellia asteriadis TaxID=517723 RepID=A0ABP3WLY6_9GAMM
MVLIDVVLSVLGLAPPQGLADSMSQSKTLTLMVVIGLLLFAGFIGF